MIIGLSGYARVGKDLAAEALAERGWRRVAFADKLRDCLYALNPIVAWEQGFGEQCIRDNNGVLWMPVYLEDVIDMFGWNGYKETQYAIEIRRLLQRLGTDAGRNLLGNNIWVDAVLNDLDEDGKYVFTDCRFPNEAEAIASRGGQIWRISRPGIGPANDHPSETSLDNWPWDKVILNEGTKEDFKCHILRLV